MKLDIDSVHDLLPIRMAIEGLYHQDDLNTCLLMND